MVEIRKPTYLEKVLNSYSSMQLAIESIQFSRNLVSDELTRVLEVWLKETHGIELVRGKAEIGDPIHLSFKRGGFFQDGLEITVSAWNGVKKHGDTNLEFPDVTTHSKYTLTAEQIRLFMGGEPK